MVAIAVMAPAIWVVVERIDREPARARLRTRSNHYEIRMKGWEWIAKKQPPGSDDRTECLGIAKWYKVRLEEVRSRVPDRKGIAEEELQVRQQEAKLGTRLGVTGIAY